MECDLRKIEGINRHETEYLYKEIFLRESYLRHGVSLPADAIVFDVGANIGMFSLFVGLKCPRASLFSFEPVPPIFDKLKKNIGTLSIPANLFQFGLSDVEGEASFVYYPGYSTLSVQETYADTPAEKKFIKRQALNEQRRNGTLDPTASSDLDELLEYRLQEVRYSCQLRPLSDVIEQYSLTRIDLLKVDVQRAELNVLHGIREPHWPIIQQIAMEVHNEPGAVANGQLRQLTTDLEGRGFAVITDQDEFLSGSDRYNLVARRGAR